MLRNKLDMSCDCCDDDLRDRGSEGVTDTLSITEVLLGIRWNVNVAGGVADATLPARDEEIETANPDGNGAETGAGLRCGAVTSSLIARDSGAGGSGCGFTLLDRCCNAARAVSHTGPSRTGSGADFCSCTIPAPSASYSAASMTCSGGGGGGSACAGTLRRNTASFGCWGGCVANTLRCDDLYRFLGRRSDGGPILDARADVGVAYPPRSINTLRLAENTDRFAEDATDDLSSGV